MPDTTEHERTKVAALAWSAMLGMSENEARFREHLRQQDTGCLCSMAIPHQSDVESANEFGLSVERYREIIQEVAGKYRGKGTNLRKFFDEC